MPMRVKFDLASDKILIFIQFINFANTEKLEGINKLDLLPSSFCTVYYACLYYYVFIWSLV
jgi:hypothetical protein